MHVSYLIVFITQLYLFIYKQYYTSVANCCSFLFLNYNIEHFVNLLHLFPSILKNSVKHLFEYIDPFALVGKMVHTRLGITYKI